MYLDAREADTSEVLGSHGVHNPWGRRKGRQSMSPGALGHSEVEGVRRKQPTRRMKGNEENVVP